MGNRAASRIQPSTHRPVCKALRTRDIPFEARPHVWRPGPATRPPSSQSRWVGGSDGPPGPRNLARSGHAGFESWLGAIRAVRSLAEQAIGCSAALLLPGRAGAEETQGLAREAIGKRSHGPRV